ncbi:HlyD family efflux transporter periplasmic adaptor subunit [Paucibacter sp. APW11]|uniref:HlyD family efflux transporter periplasmic adaptor subunit n=1 Tax=Roseateles aquae TaxID=3077235 RepID=A0ABU3PI35_9BURK|nr:biotin/lipoyl-binding protein [Paucibacter sp. APW11]MDT9002114.1 HlyD family efflux transporter periplasmic adaptor subunit [Paucibacter sp. APW11]
MDEIVPQRRRPRWLAAALTGALLLIVSMALWAWAPRGLQVPASDLRIAAVEAGTFLDEIAVRAKAEALNSVIIDSIDSGRVEAVEARDGVLVKQGDVLFRISNSQRHLELLQRQSEHAQQISNLATLRLAFEQGTTEHERRLIDLEHNLALTRRKIERDKQLALQGFISESALQESQDAASRDMRALANERTHGSSEMAVKRNVIVEMERAIAKIESGLALVGRNVDALVVRAPIAGRLTDFKLQVGQSVKTDQHIGRIDDPSRFKLTAQVDEYYLNRVAVGRMGHLRHDGKDYGIQVSQVFPQIKDGRFSIELVFSSDQPATLNPGQSLDVQVTLGEPKAALVLPNSPFVADSGGAWAFVLDANGVDASKKPIQLGRRNNRQVEVLAGLQAGDKVVVSSYAAFGNVTHLQLKR